MIDEWVNFDEVDLMFCVTGNSRRVSLRFKDQIFIFADIRQSLQDVFCDKPTVSWNSSVHIGRQRELKDYDTFRKMLELIEFVEGLWLLSYNHPGTLNAVQHVDDIVAVVDAFCRIFKLDENGRCKANADYFVTKSDSLT